MRTYTHTSEIHIEKDIEEFVDWLTHEGIEHMVIESTFECSIPIDNTTTVTATATLGTLSKFSDDTIVRKPLRAVISFTWADFSRQQEAELHLRFPDIWRMRNDSISTDEIVSAGEIL